MRQTYLIICFDNEGQPIKSMLIRAPLAAVEARIASLAAWEKSGALFEAYPVDLEGPPMRIGDPVVSVSPGWVAV